MIGIMDDDAVKARKEIGAAATSALPQLSGLANILGIGPIETRWFPAGMMSSVK